MRNAWLALICCAGLQACSAYDPGLLHNGGVDSGLIGPDTGVDAGPDAQHVPDATSDDGGALDGDASNTDDCVPTTDEFCPLACPEVCNQQDDDCDQAIDEETTPGDGCHLTSALGACFEGACAIVSCTDGQRDCDGIASTGCETAPDDPNNCGLCGIVCSYPQGIATCTDGLCALTDCEPGYGDCDGTDDNGCELRLDSPDNCGACDVTCGTVTNGQGGCVDGACAITECDSGYGDCDNDPDNGCEAPLDNPTHCGSCEQMCSFDTAGALCSAMTCVPDGCSVGLGDCDGEPDNGCEISVRDDEDNCGACGSLCRVNLLGNAQVATCVSGECSATTCTIGYGDCDAERSNGCEASLHTLSHCGGCNTACAFNNAVGDCDEGSCDFVRCLDGFGNCDSNVANGCETPLNTLSNCGTCGTPCTVSSGTPSCTGGICSNASCNPGFADCNGDGISCESDLRSDNAHCGSCTSTCGALPNATGTCQASTCRIQTCDAGYGDCDGNAQNGCEVRLNTTSHCGMCGRACNYDQAGATCNAGTCAIGACNPGWASCDSNNTNGCETQLNTLSSCGSCGDTCALPNALEACSGGSCIVVACDGDDLGNCDGNAQNGCEQGLSTLAHCGTCNAPCALANASESCVLRTCQLDACDAGYANCDSVRANGCERSIRTTLDCGSCGSVCDLAHAQESCSSGTCSLTTCDAGWGSCDNNDATGCEQALNSLSHCGQCGTTCSLSNASESCASGTCQVVTCDPGFADCDVQASNGCEQALNTLTHCGGCNVACDPNNAGGSCASGACAITTCDAGFGDCDGLAATGCERALNGGSCRPQIGRVEIDDDHSCAVKANGLVTCWGYNASGRLGDGTTAERWAPGLVVNINDASLASTGDSHSCALRNSGQVMCWGNNGLGRLGDGTTTDRSAPVSVSGLNDAVGVSAGSDFTCALRNSGQVVCWGNNATGRLGDGTTTNRSTPVAVSGISDAVQVSAGEAHACVVRGNGQVMCWGDNGSGRLGDGTITNRSTPVAVNGISDALQVTAGETHTCAVRESGQVMCWGSNVNGRLGDNTVTERRTPVAANGLLDAVQVAAGLYHTCAVRSSGQVMCWGYNANGRLGDNTGTERRVPTAVNGLSDATEVTTGDHHSCAARVNGQVMCWGYGAIGRLGNGTNDDRLVPTAVSGFSNGIDIDVGGANTCAVLSDGAVHCAGYGGRNGNGTSVAYRGTIAAIGVDDATQLEVGWVHGCLVRENGQVWCWGGNDAGQLGDNTTAARSAPVRAGLIADVTQVSANGWTTCAVSSGHLLYCWGYNAQGQLGIANTVSSATPLTVLGITDAAQVSVGYHHTCYLRQNGTVACAGEGAYGAIGNNATANQITFVPVSNLTNVTQVGTGYYHSCALKTGGGISCWGRNTVGQLGDGSTTNRTTPVNVTGITDAIKVVGGELYTCALRQTGQVMCWGDNANGRLGDGTQQQRITPVAVTGVSDAIDIDAGQNQTCALRANGTAVCWGYNGYGQLGDGTVTDRTSQVPIVALP